MAKDIGMIGLGTMGKNLLLNMMDHGFSVAGYDKDQNKVMEANQSNVYSTTDMMDFIASLKTPRAIMLLVPAGKIVDDVIAELIPHLDTNDLIIDAGNSHFIDTNRRIAALEKQQVNFLGIGISGGEEGARHGPSIMPGGKKATYARISNILQAVSAKVNDEPCVAYLGESSSGHYVKMVHNGIEYGIMQLIAETYDLMKRGLHFTNQELHDVYDEWNNSELNSYLLEITRDIFAKKDDDNGKDLIDKIVAVAKQNGTGMWTSQSAMELQTPVPSIDIAVSMRDLSVFVSEQQQAEKLYKAKIEISGIDKKVFVEKLKSAYFCSMITIYAQGMALLNTASEKYQYQLQLETVAKIWRGGCIIRAAFLENICAAFKENNHLANLLLNKHIANIISTHEDNWREMISVACKSKIPMPILMTSLSYFDAYRDVSQSANLIQAQRDYFGSHTYARKDKPGMFHTEWSISSGGRS